MSDFNDGLLPTPCLRMDTHFGDEYESIEFGDGTGYIKAAPILAKVGALHEEIDSLRDESAELRELVRDMWRFTGAACEKYPRLFDPSAQGGQMVQLNAIDAFEQRMRELGVEV